MRLSLRVIVAGLTSGALPSLLTRATSSRPGTPNRGATDPLNQALPIPADEATARNGNITCPA
ncbi:MAG TPA: hypothetical protein VG432_13055 [Gemmatimonadaceae bacterium]|nr:hypothetical protein [Gemmatimonadaceae bacterium]